MTEFDNTNRGSIWKNDEKKTDKHPDFTGSLNVEGVEYWVSAWKRKESAPPKAPALSFSIKRKQPDHVNPSTERSISQRAMPRRPALISSGKINIIPDDDDMRDEIPF